MILKALYDYYQRHNDLPALGMEEKEIGFLIVLNREGKFLRFEDCRIDKNTAKTILVKQHIGRTSAIAPNYLYDSAGYVFGYSGEGNSKDAECLCAFIQKIKEISDKFPDNENLKAICTFYGQSHNSILEQVQSDPLWTDITKSLTKKYSVFSFRIEGDTRIVAEKKEIMCLDEIEDDNDIRHLCLVTGEKGSIVETTTATMIPGSQATAKLVSFQVSSGYDSYGKSKGFNAPISRRAEFAYTTALNSMLSKGSHNKCMFSSRTYLFWASNSKDASMQAEQSLFDMLGFVDNKEDDPNARIENVRRVFRSINSGVLNTGVDDRFYILGLAPNSARIAVVYWSDTLLKEFAGKILKHFENMEIIDERKDKRPYMGIRDMLGAVTLGGKQSDASPNLPDALAKSIFEGHPYPETLFSSCIRRIRAEQEVAPYGNPCRAAILKAYLNRFNDDNKNIEIMLDKENTNEGYLCGRLFAVLENLQYAANKQDSIRSSYMNAASSTPSAVFSTILKLSNTHYGKLAKEHKGLAIYFDKQKEEILSMLGDFPDTLELKDQGRFFLGYYHQKNMKENKENEL